MKSPFFLLLPLLLGSFAAPALPLGSQEIFELHENAVFQVRVINRETGKKSSIGSGFIYATDRTLVTNYHVVSSFIEQPDDYVLQYVGTGGRSGPLKLMAVDAVHDLALVQADTRLGDTLSTGPPPPKGAALYAMGNPLDLGLTIAAGTNGGVLDQTDDSRILFSGSLNPGMSGGPTFDDTGTVVGVNVSTARNDISFVVPTDYLAPLVTQRHDDTDDMLATISGQIRRYQSDYIDDMLQSDWPTTTLRSIRIPGTLSATVRCWDASPKAKPDRLYRQLAISCQNENDIYLTDEIDVGKLLYEFVWLESEGLEALRFTRLYKSLNNSQFGGRAREDDVSRFDCETEFVAVTGMTLKTTVCRRDYKRYQGLSDILVTAAMVGREGTGFIFNLDLSGTDSRKANELLTRFLEEIAWQD
jgi:hypothetical protein